MIVLVSTPSKTISEFVAGSILPQTTSVVPVNSNTGQESPPAGESSVISFQVFE